MQFYLLNWGFNCKWLICWLNFTCQTEDSTLIGATEDVILLVKLRIQLQLVQLRMELLLDKLRIQLVLSNWGCDRFLSNWGFNLIREKIFKVVNIICHSNKHCKTSSKRALSSFLEKIRYLGLFEHKMAVRINLTPLRIIKMAIRINLTPFIEYQKNGSKD